MQKHSDKAAHELQRGEYRQGRNACLQKHSDEAAHEPQRGEVSGQGRAPLPRHSVRREEECLLAGAFRRCGARAPKGRSWSFCDEESPRFLSLARRSLHFTAFRVRDDIREAPSLFSLLPPLCKGRWTTRKRRTEGLSCSRDTDLYNPPASPRSAHPQRLLPGRSSAEGGDEGERKGTVALPAPSSVTS